MSQATVSAKARRAEQFNGGRSSTAPLRSASRARANGNASNRTGSYKGIFQLRDEEFGKRGGVNIYNADENIGRGAIVRSASSDASSQFVVDNLTTDRTHYPIEALIRNGRAR